MDHFHHSMRQLLAPMRRTLHFYEEHIRAHGADWFSLLSHSYMEVGIAAVKGDVRLRERLIELSALCDAWVQVLNEVDSLEEVSDEQVHQAEPS